MRSQYENALHWANEKISRRLQKSLLWQLIIWCEKKFLHGPLYQRGLEYDDCIPPHLPGYKDLPTKKNGLSGMTRNHPIIAIISRSTLSRSDSAIDLFQN